jgi:cytochrome b6-f complex iron-sulfur subunit
VRFWCEQGLKGDATYLIVKEDKSIEKYGLNAVCTHLGCVVPWNKAENKFICPCHGSQYDATGAWPIHTPHLTLVIHLL